MSQPLKTLQKPISRKSQALYDIAIGNYALFTQTQGAHWNYTGSDFASMHLMFEQQYQNLYLAADELSERIRALGDLAPLDIRELTQSLESLNWFKSVPEAPDSIVWVETLIYNHQRFANHLTAAIKSYEKFGDTVTHDILAARLMFHDKTLWMLKSLFPSFENEKSHFEESTHIRTNNLF